MSNSAYHSIWKEILIGIIIILLLLLVLNPGDIWMPTLVQMTCSTILLGTFAIFSFFVWKEKATDEREQQHRLIAGRFAFIIGSGILVIALFAQSITHTVDPWIVVALAAMIISKSIGSIWAKTKQ